MRNREGTVVLLWTMSSRYGSLHVCATTNFCCYHVFDYLLKVFAIDYSHDGDELLVYLTSWRRRLVLFFSSTVFATFMAGLLIVIIVIWLF